MIFKEFIAITILASVLVTVKASSVITGRHAASSLTTGDIVTEGDESLVVAKTEPYRNGTLTYWVDSPESDTAKRTAPDLIPRACGTNDVKCSGDHLAGVSHCSDLVRALNDDGNSILTISPRSVCFGTSGGDLCCVSWSNAQLGIRKNYLISAASKIINKCKNNKSLVSGLARNVNLNGNCMTECVSNRAVGCR